MIINEIIAKRFWDKVSEPDRKGCMNWTACTYLSGYGQVFIDKKRYGAHRMAWVIANQKNIPRGKQVLHSCDNTLCCNPSHLFLGTHKDNMEDMKRKGRQRIQATSGNFERKLTPSQVRKARHDYKSGEAVRALSREHDVDPATMRDILHRRSYKDVI